MDSYIKLLKNLNWNMKSWKNSTLNWFFKKIFCWKAKLSTFRGNWSNGCLIYLGGRVNDSISDEIEKENDFINNLIQIMIYSTLIKAKKDYLC